MLWCAVYGDTLKSIIVCDWSVNKGHKNKYIVNLNSIFFFILTFLALKLSSICPQLVLQSHVWADGYFCTLQGESQDFSASHKSSLIMSMLITACLYRTYKTRAESEG